MAFSLVFFIYSVLLSLICTYIPGVCNFLHLVLLAVGFVVISFLVFLAFSYLIRINFGTEKIWRNWRKMVKITKLNPRQIQ